MKDCAYCRSQIPDDALRCQYCTSWVEQQTAKHGDKAHVVFVLDQDLYRFAKFAVAVLGVMILVGVYLFGLDLKDTSKDVKTIREEVKTARDEVKTARDDAKATRETVKTEAAGVKVELDKTRAEVQAIKKQVADQSAEAAAAAEQAKSVVAEMMQSRERVRGIVSQIDPATGAVTGLIRIELERHLARALSPQQLAKLRESLQEGPVEAPEISKEEVLRLAQSDVARAVAFFQQHGLDVAPPSVKIHPDPTLANAFWDGKAITYGMGMVNGEIFGPYSPTIAMHEATHSLFSISFEGQSGTVTESICDVMAALITGEWTVGYVRNRGGPRQFLRSLKAPGSAYDNSGLGKDNQPDHMSGFVSKDYSPLTNTGILNKAAYLVSEGGTHRGVDVGTGLGREKTAKLYMDVMKKLKLMKNRKVEFTQFKELVVRSAQDVFPTAAEQRVVTDSFRAVGL